MPMNISRHGETTNKTKNCFVSLSFIFKKYKLKQSYLSNTLTSRTDY